MNQTSFATPWGTGWFFWDQNRIYRLLLPGELFPAPATFVDNDPFGVREQLWEYFGGRRRCFQLPLFFSGTSFQMLVWEELTRIPYGQRRNYQQVAAAIKLPKAARAVGNACHANPLPILVPCHRVVLRDGRPGGFGGGTALKVALLELELKNERRNRG